MRIQVPSTLDLEHIANDYQLPDDITLDSLYYLVHLIWYMPVINKDNWKNGYTYLKGQYLQNALGNKYKKHIDYLIESGIIERTKGYVSGVTSYGYRMANVNHELVHHRLVTIENKTQIKRIYKIIENHYSISKSVKNNYSHLYRWFNDSLTVITDNIEDSPHRYKLDYINDSRYRMVIDKFGKRLHTNLTNLPKPLRQCLRYDGQELIELDVKCSQFYFAIKLILDYLKKEDREVYKILTQLNSSEDRLNYLCKCSSYPDITNYINLVTSGKLYDFMVEQFQVEFNYQYSRDDMKDLMFNYLFGRVSSKSKTKSLFKSLFPSVYKVFNYYKIDDFKILSKKLQQLESKLILRTICKDNRIADIPLFTIHDAILTTSNNINTVNNLMNEILTNTILFNPTISISNN